MKFNKDKFVESFKTRSFKSGGYSIVMTLIVIAVVVIVNLLFAKLPDSITRPDLSTIKLYDFTGETVELVKNVDEKVTIYLWAETGSEDAQIKEFLSRYSELNSNISIEYVDPALNPAFLDKYEQTTLASNSLIIESDKRYKIVNYSDIYQYDYDENILYQYYMYYGSDYMSYLSPNVFNAENSVTNAVDYVTSDTLPIAYFLTGHGETALTDTFKSYIADDNIELKDLSLISLDAVPDDADCVIINAPTNDISEYELDLLLTYMNGGGRVLLFTNFQYPGGENVAALCEAYGLEAVDGLVLESSSNYVSQPYYLIAKKERHDITDPLIDSDSYVIMPLAHGIKTIDAYRSSLTISTLLETSDDAFSKVDVENMTTFDKEEGDIDGGFILGAAVTETVGDNEARFVWYSTSELLNDSLNAYSVGGNSNLILNTLSWMTDRQQGITIRSLSLEASTLTMSDSASGFWFILLTFVLPISIVGFGFAVWYKRRKR